ncbi:MAG TPA: hypothetical protein VHY22_06095 [Chthoniobacteraceae bacterium]|jgi:hypothetical protein|nr:hypothetical protein [Chthoniobacteraceae bacterium]
MSKPQPATRLRTCRACGRQFEYPLKGNKSTRFHCEDCVDLPPETCKLAERLFSRIQKLEMTVKRLEARASGAPAATAHCESKASS